ncbi:MAG: hypothetical protein K1X74_21210 [Pirellulales bacterium]|nr:hypothetical protein [Pirellulales bacterium]
MSMADRASLRAYLAGLTETTFQERLGVADPALLDYLVELLVRFVHIDAIHAIRNLTGRRLEEVAEMLVEAELRLGDARREVHRHIGDVTLFWSGVYPEALEKLHKRAKYDFFVDYCETGKRSYRIASTIAAPEKEHENDVLARLSYEFELCAFGLRQVRDQWQARREEPPQRLG